MSMKLPFQTNALAKAEAALVRTEAKLEELRAEREQALLQYETTEQVEKLDASIAHQVRTAGIYRDKITALRLEARRQRREAAERLKEVAITELEARLAKRNQAAARLQDAVKQLGEALRAFHASRDMVVANWPDCLPRPSMTDLRTERVDRELAWALYAAGSPAWNRPCAIPAPSNAGLGVTGIAPKGIAGCVAEAAAAFLDRMRREPLALEEDDETGEVAA